MASESAGEARAELQAWYVHHLLPKLAQAVSRGRAGRGEIEALDAGVRELIDLPRVREQAA
jgi:hypothetical protein